MNFSRRFPPPWSVDQSLPDSFVVKDANGIMVATVHCRDDLQKWSFGHSKLTSDEARRIAAAIARIPEFIMGRRGFYPPQAAPSNNKRSTERLWLIVSTNSSRRFGIQFQRINQDRFAVARAGL